MQANLYVNVILLPFGEISRDKINLISGTMTAPLLGIYNAPRSNIRVTKVTK